MKLEVGDTVKVVKEDRFDSDVKEGDLFQVSSTNSGGPFSTVFDTIELQPLDQDSDVNAQHAFPHWIEKID